MLLTVQNSDIDCKKKKGKRKRANIPGAFCHLANNKKPVYLCCEQSRGPEFQMGPSDFSSSNNLSCVLCVRRRSTTTVFTV